MSSRATPLGKHPQDLQKFQGQECSFPQTPNPKLQHSQELGAPSCWARAGFPRRRCFLQPQQEAQSCPPQADVNPGGVFFPFSYLKRKQNSLHSPHVKCCSCCRQTIILQSHNDPGTEKRGKVCTPPQPSLGESKPRSLRIKLTVEEQQEVGRRAGERTGKEETESLKVRTNVNLTPVLYEQHTASLLDK